MLVGATASAIGYFIGPYVGKVATKLGEYVAQLVRDGQMAIKNLSADVRASLRTLFKETCCFVAGTLINTPNGKIPIEKKNILFG